MAKWRLIDTDLGHPYYVTALEEAIASARATELVPDTLHFYRREPPGISIGYFRKIEEDINVEICDQYNVKLVRRMTGGGTIFTDKEQLIYSIITKTPLGNGIKETFEIVCNAIINALKSFNIHVEHKPPNDILLNGKKISGSAQTLKKGVVLQHGTIIVGTDLELMNKVLKRPNLDYVTSIINEQKVDAPTIPDLKNALISSFTEAFGVTITKGKLNNFEIDLVKKLENNKYSSNDWNFKR